MNQKYVKYLVFGSSMMIIASVLIFFQKDIRVLLSNQEDNDQKAIENSPTPAYFRRIRTPLFIEGYSITLKNELAFVKYLEERKVFGRANLTNDKNFTGFNGLEEIQIAIRKGPKPPDEKPDYNNAFTALSKGLVQVNFFLEDDELNDPNIGDLILKNTLGTIFRIVDKESKDEDLELDVDRSFGELKNNRDVNIILKKN